AGAFARRAAKAGARVVARTARDVMRRVTRGRPVTTRFINRRGVVNIRRYWPFVVRGRLLLRPA
ncbi:MAG: hypothetical protein WBN48_18970, partial [Thiogranum sp.]